MTTKGSTATDWLQAPFTRSFLLKLQCFICLIVAVGPGGRLCLPVALSLLVGQLKSIASSRADVGQSSPQAATFSATRPDHHIFVVDGYILDESANKSKESKNDLSASPYKDLRNPNGGQLQGEAHIVPGSAIRVWTHGQAIEP